MAIFIGIDLGSVSVKAALFSRDAADAPFFKNHSSHPLFQSVRQLTTPAQEDCWLAITRYARISGNPVQETRALLESLVGLVGRSALGEVAGTGRGAKLLSSEFDVSKQNEFRALCKAVELLLPKVHTLFEMGGRTPSTYALTGMATMAGSASPITRPTAIVRPEPAASSTSRRDACCSRSKRSGHSSRHRARRTDRGSLLCVCQKRHDSRAAEGIHA